MRLGMIGLGRMGANITRRLMRDGHEIVAFDRDAAAVSALASEGAIAAASLEEVASKLSGRRIFWVMLPAGMPTESTILALLDLAQPGDIVVDGGNTFYKDDVRRAKICGEKQVLYVDVGTSGGVWGLERGYCMMIGGEKEAVDFLDPVFETLAPGLGTIERTPGRSESKGDDSRAEKGYIHTGPVGSGHFVKMIHNGIEYGLMQAYAEGFDILQARGSAVQSQPHGHRRSVAPRKCDLFLAPRSFCSRSRQGSGIGSIHRQGV